MVDTKTTPAPPPSPVIPVREGAFANAPRPAEEKNQEQEITDARHEEAKRLRQITKDARAGKEVSFEGARPDFEPLPGEAKGSINEGLVIGGPVLTLEEQADIVASRAPGEIRNKLSPDKDSGADKPKL